MDIIRRPFRYRYGNAVLVLIGLNLLAFLAQLTIPYATEYLALTPDYVLRGGFVWQFATYMFAHDTGNFSHILFNMLGLFIFGVQVERHIGTAEFVLFYLVSGILAGVLSFFAYMLTGAETVHLLGASGALFAVQLAYATFFPSSTMLIWGIIPVRAATAVLGFTALELFSSVFGLSNGVAHLTHLFGFAVGWVYFLVRFGANPWRALTGR